jgi:hypothetical protein
MIRFVLAATLLAGCRLSLENENSPDPNATGRVCTMSNSQPCLDAVNAPPTLSWIETNIFDASCNFSGCHKGPDGESALDLRPGMSGAHLVNAPSFIDSSRKFVVPNDVESSWLMLMLRDFAPGNANPPATGLPSAGGMPQSADPLCCQKIEAIERWINAGAPTN